MVWRLNLSNTNNNNINVINFIIASIVNPVLYIDQQTDMMYVMDKYNGTLVRCNLLNAYLKNPKYKPRYSRIGSTIRYLPVITSITVEKDSERWRTNNS